MQNDFSTELWAKGEIIIKNVLETVQITLNIPFIELLTIVLHSESPGRSKKLYTKNMNNGDSSYSDEIVA